jgi:carbonic anhydrase
MPCLSRKTLTQIKRVPPVAQGSIQQELGTNDLAELRGVYGVYLLETREIWAPRLGRKEGTGLAAAPSDLDGFVELGDAIVQSSRVTALLT